MRNENGDNPGAGGNGGGSSDDAPTALENRQALDQIIHRLYEKLKPLAVRVSWPKISPTLNGSALLNEAYLKLVTAKSLSAKSDGEIVQIFAHVMRQILIDRIRHKRTEKHGGGVVHLSLDADDPSAPQPQSPTAGVSLETLITLESAMLELERENPRQARIIDCRFYLGLTADETAMFLRVAKTTVEREHRKALEFLNARIRPKR